MIQAVTDYILAALGKIERPDGSLLKVYPPEAYRDLGKIELPCLALALTIVPKDEMDRPHHKVFIPSDEQQSIEVPERFGYLFHAEVTASKQEPYHIEAEQNLISIRVGSNGSWSDQEVITLVPGTRDAWEIVRCSNYYARRITAEDSNGSIHFRTAEPGTDLEILDIPGSAHEALGLTLGVASHLTRTGPVSYTVKPHPIPVILRYRVDLRAAVKGQRDVLLPMVLNLFPERSWPTINGQSPLLRRSGADNLDELAEPEWWSTFTLEVDCVWMDRKDAYEVSSILEPQIEFAGL